MKKSAASEKDKTKWSKVLIAGMMSSEELVIVKMRMSSLLNLFSGVMKEWHFIFIILMKLV